MNKYPFFADLKTSSKQSKKISILANTIRAENRIIQSLKNAAAHTDFPTRSIEEVPEVNLKLATL